MNTVFKVSIPDINGVQIESLYSDYKKAKRRAEFHFDNFKADRCVEITPGKYCYFVGTYKGSHCVVWVESTAVL